MEIKNLAILKGKNIVIDNGRIIVEHIPNGEKTQLNVKQVEAEAMAYGEVRSELLFSNGEIELKFKRTSFRTGILLLFPLHNEEHITIGLSYYDEAFVIKSNNRFEDPICIAGKTEFYKLEDEHTLKVVVLGSNIKLYVDKVLLCETFLNIKEGPFMIRMVSEGKLSIYDIKVHIVKPKVFVIMQFSKEYNELYEDVIIPIVEQRGFECIRADEFYTSTPILKDIIDSIKQSSIIIAEITPDNPNVFYEIGYSHAIDKPTILLCDRKRDKLPFDLSSFRTLFYENTIAGKKKIEENLKKYLDNLI